MVYSKIIALMSGRQIGDYLTGEKVAWGLRRRPYSTGHGTVPKTGQFLKSNSRPPSDLREIKPVAGSTNSCRSKRPPFEVRKFPNQIHQIEMGCQAHQFPLFGSDLVRFRRSERSSPTCRPCHPEGCRLSLLQSTMLHTPGSAWPSTVL